MRFFLLLLLIFPVISIANAPPRFCGTGEFHKMVASSHLIDAYYAPGKYLSSLDLKEMLPQFSHISVLTYANGGIANGKLYLSPTHRHNLVLIKELRQTSHLSFAINLAVGGWIVSDKFSKIFTDHKAREVFIHSVVDVLEKNELDGIDIDWENEALASEEEIEGLATFYRELHAKLHPHGYCVTGALPAISFYWKQYPSARHWHQAVDWVNVKGYDLHGTFGPYTAPGSNLYPLKHPTLQTTYPYSESSSVQQALEHYESEGLSRHQLVVGVPFYCHRYYTVHLEDRGLWQEVYDPNLNAQIPYKTSHFYDYAGQRYEEHDSAWALIPTHNATNNQRPRIYEFLSCETPETLKNKMHYIKSHHYGGVSMWELGLDVSWDSQHPQSLLKALA